MNLDPPLDVTGFADIVNWLMGQWWMYVVMALVLFAVIVVTYLPRTPMHADPSHPSFGTEANELALGCLQICSRRGNLWNDPTASRLSEHDAEELAAQLDLATPESWQNTYAALSEFHQRHPEWTTALSTRRALIEEIGLPPSVQSWTSALVEQGMPEESARSFIEKVLQLEGEVRTTLGRITLHPEIVVLDVDAYTYAMLVSLATWGVVFGYIDEDEARRRIHVVNELARPRYDSWEHFGLSYIVSRALHLTDGAITEMTFNSFVLEPSRLLAAALSDRQRGPWAQLPWHR